MEEDRATSGMKIRRFVLGDAYVDKAEATKTDFDSDFQHFLTATAWGEVWSRPGLDRKTRSLLTIAMLATLGHHAELAAHVMGSRRNGATLEEIRETFIHVAVYAGAPAANSAFKIAKETLGEINRQK